MISVVACAARGGVGVLVAHGQSSGTRVPSGPGCDGRFLPIELAQARHADGYDFSLRADLKELDGRGRAGSAEPRNDSDHRLAERVDTHRYVLLGETKEAGGDRGDFANAGHASDR